MKDHRVALRNLPPESKFRIEGDNGYVDYRLHSIGTPFAWVYNTKPGQPPFKMMETTLVLPMEGLEET